MKLAARHAASDGYNFMINRAEAGPVGGVGGSAGRGQGALSSSGESNCSGGNAWSICSIAVLAPFS